MTTSPASPFVLVGDPTAAACEGDFCPVPEPDVQVAVPEDEAPALSPIEEAAASAAGS